MKCTKARCNSTTGWFKVPKLASTMTKNTFIFFLKSRLACKDLEPCSFQLNLEFYKVSIIYFNKVYLN